MCRGKREIPEKTRRPMASSCTIPTCKNLVIRPVIEPGLPWWEARRLTAQPPRQFLKQFNPSICGFLRTTAEIFNANTVIRVFEATARGHLGAPEDRRCESLCSIHHPDDEEEVGRVHGAASPGRQPVRDVSDADNPLGACGYVLSAEEIAFPGLARSGWGGEGQGDQGLITRLGPRSILSPLTSTNPLGKHYARSKVRTSDLRPGDAFSLVNGDAGLAHDGSRNALYSPSRSGLHTVEADIAPQALDTPHYLDRLPYNKKIHALPSNPLFSLYDGATVDERLDCSPPAYANRVQSPAGPLSDFRKWESCRTMPLVGKISLNSQWCLLHTTDFLSGHRFLPGPRWYSGHTTRLPPRQTVLDSRRDPRAWESWWTMPLAGFPQGAFRFPVSCIVVLLHTHHRFTLIGSQDPDVKNLSVDTLPRPRAPCRVPNTPCLTFPGGADLFTAREMSPEPRARMRSSAAMNGNEWRGETGDTRENLTTIGIARHDSHMRKSERDPAED
ncbi:hypothetical protein PR048_010346 [Dryococelus australis]|uniref:Uncharacterized protein n=1 Tax=Dryococelus australis TaxID=614101 RepID=A0ABQ9I2E8_9NEOP|nr:hypothetical protein PR048_010346 [Dryococelus australis]